ncbi:hypothetical protein CDAR_544081 [Caerostris darwini]|uniref:Ycf15 n=1 Tax=Caerostris darwini TaxID=1538125 RepID=A0AAV4TI38_9ARAC|nr:hypothetical protein CDAR_544081 [Caerostris darwini]
MKQLSHDKWTKRPIFPSQREIEPRTSMRNLLPIRSSPDTHESGKSFIALSFQFPLEKRRPPHIPLLSNTGKGWKENKKNEWKNLLLFFSFKKWGGEGFFHLEP